MKVERISDQDGVIYSVTEFSARYYDVDEFVRWIRGLSEKRVTIWFDGNEIEFRGRREREAWVDGFETGRKVHADEIGPPDSGPW